MCIIAISCVRIKFPKQKVDNRMDRQSFTDLIQTKFKMVRIEAGYTQDTMAQTIGLSKKTLVQIEKREYYQTGQLVFQFVHYSETLKY